MNQMQTIKRQWKAKITSPGEISMIQYKFDESEINLKESAHTN